MKLNKAYFLVVSMVALFSLVLTACAPAATQASADTQSPADTQVAEVAQAPADTQVAAATQAPNTQASASTGTHISVALIMAGSISDGGWNTLAYKGLEQLKAEGFQTAYSENIESANITAVARGYADDGYKLIIGNGWQFSTALAELGKDYPDTKFFVMAKGTDDGTIPENVQFVDSSDEYGGYMAGSLAALVSKTHNVGFVGGGDNPAQRMLGNAFEQGATETVSGTKVLKIITGDYNDAAKGREAALTMIGNGADVIWHAADITGLGVITGVVEGKALAIGMYSDQTSIAYNSFASSVMEDLTYVVINRAHAVESGEFEGGGNWKPPFNDIYKFVAGGTEFNPTNVSETVQQAMQKVMQDLIDGKIKVTTSTN